ncbi:enoyl-CoA hydratase/isomerase family protein [Halobacillus andaensis]|uniref:enoyl-CoA hydratase/isomerase family protein n=1 Tax=Halobacillus andaensis TaxID=1176239 RepID=UPI003D71E669
MQQIRTICDDHGAVTIQLNRREKMNAITNRVSKLLSKEIGKLKNDPDIKCLVITGAGDEAFCAGGDLNELHGGLTEEKAYRALQPMKQVLYELAAFPLPTFAFLNGQARGGGCEIATACDFRYGLDTGHYGFIQGNLGITPGWGGGELLYKRIQADRAAHWLMDAQMYNADQAYQIGWLNKIVEKDQLNIETLLPSFLNKTQSQLKIFKSQYLRAISFHDAAEAMEDEVRRCASLWESKEHLQAVKKFLSTRKKY